MTSKPPKQLSRLDEATLTFKRVPEVIVASTVFIIASIITFPIRAMEAKSKAKATTASNWSKLKNKVAKPNSSVHAKAEAASIEAESAEQAAHQEAKLSAKIKANYIGLDCEMVGIGATGVQSALARCCVVDFDGEVIYDEFVRPPGFVTDFRTKWSGVRKKDLRHGTAISLAEVSEGTMN